MFDFVRRHNRVMQILLFLLIFPSFVLFGLEGYNRFTEGGPAVAKVDGKPITQQQWDQEHKVQVDQLRQQMPGLDAKILDTPQARYATLERMVRDRVLIAAMHKLRLQPTDKQVRDELATAKTLDPFYDANGKLDVQAFSRATGKSPEQFRAEVEQDIGMRRAALLVSSSPLVTQAQANVSLGSYYERREVQLARFDPADYLAKVTPTPADLEAYYKDNAAQFQSPEQATIEYVVLDLDTVRKGIAINEADVRTAYEQYVKQLAEQEERRAAHILVPVAKGAPQADKDKAKARAEELLQAARKAPASFGDLARKNSGDDISKANGGDLDWSARKGMASKALADGVFSLKKGEIGLVESEYGWHVVQLNDVRAPQAKSFEQMRGELEAEGRKQLAQRKFAETAETFKDAVYEAADGFKSVADRFKLEVKTAANVSRNPPPDAKGPLANTRLLGALFSPDSLEKKRNTEAVETAPSQLVSARIVQYSPARTLPFAEVQETVRKRVQAAKAAEMARKDGQDKLAAWKATPANATLTEKIVMSRGDPARQPQDVVEAALRADPTALPALQGVDLGTQGYTVVRVNRVVPRDTPPPQVAKQELAQYQRLWTDAESLAYFNLLKERFKGQILVPKPVAGADVASAR